MNLYNNIFVLLFMLIGYPSALYIAPIFSNTTYSCSQTKLGFIACQDGSPITVGFAITAPSMPIYGNFTVSQTDYANVSEPLDVFGNRCYVGSGATVSCFVTLKPFSVFSGNATVNESIRLLLASTTYPQASFYRYVNFTVLHYLNGTESRFASVYTPTIREYLQENGTYQNICRPYTICDPYIEYTLLTANRNITFSVLQVNKSLIRNAYYNISLANASLTNLLPRLRNFTTNSSLIIGNLIKSKAILANMTSNYNGNVTYLNNCRYPNGTTYSKRISSLINNTAIYSNPTTLSRSMAYLNYTRNASIKETNIIGQCKGIPASSSPIPIGVSPAEIGSFLMQQRNYVIMGIIVATIAAYLGVRLRGIREIKRIREGDKKGGEVTEPGQAVPLEPKPEQPEDSGDYVRKI